MPLQLLIHFHFHHHTTGITKSVENVFPYLEQYFDSKVFGYGINLQKITLWNLLKIVGSSKKFVIHAHRNNEILLAVALRSVNKNIKVVASRHAEKKPSSFTLKLLKQADEVVSLTKSMAETLPFRSAVIGHGVDTREFTPKPKSELVHIRESQLISVVGRIRPYKGQKDVIRATIPLLKQNPDWALAFIGKVDNKKFFQEIIDETTQAGVRDQVYHFQQTSDIGAFYQASEIVVIPSHSEGFSLVCLEAMASGRTTVATKEVGIHSNVINHGLNGYLYSKGDFRELRQILKQIIDTKCYINSQTAHEAVNAHWSIEKEAKQLSEIYQN